MHREVLNWVQSSLEWWGEKRENLSVLEFGSLDINGSVRSVLEPFAAKYIGIDPYHGKGVDIVADAAVFRDLTTFDIVVCCEVFEHTDKWPQIVLNAHKNLRDGGLFIATMAGEGRPPHSAIDENPIRDWEHYANIGYAELDEAMSIFKHHKIDQINYDIRSCGIK